MAPKLPPLPALRAFAVAARHLSFKAAAAELNVTPGAISQQIKMVLIPAKRLDAFVAHRRVLQNPCRPNRQALLIAERPAKEAFDGDSLIGR